MCGRAVRRPGSGLSGRVEVEALESLLSGRDPTTGTPLGRELLDRYTADGRVVRAVSGFDATFSAPKSLSVWWALTGDRRLLEAHDVAVTAALAHLERFGSTTRIRSNGGRLHPDTDGLTMATFRQTTSRADDPQIHTHAVISAKVQTADGRWLALDARYLKRHQRMLGGLYQSVLRAELTHRFGVDWRPIVNGQAEIAGIPDELLAVFSKRSVDIDAALADKLDEFRQREGREPSRWERAALTREASADTRSRKSGHGAADLTTRWQAEAADAGWTARPARGQHRRSRRPTPPRPTVIIVPDVIDAVSQQRSSWTRADVLQAICDSAAPRVAAVGTRLGRGARTSHRPRRSPSSSISTRPATPPGAASDGRSVWIEPTAPRFTSEPVLAQEEAILTWAMAAQADPPAPVHHRRTGTGLDPLQADAAAAVAGDDRLVLVVGPAGAGKTRMLTAAADDLHAPRPCRVRCRADGEGGPDGRARHRHPRRHRRQAAPRMAAHRPATAARVPAAGRHDARSSTKPACSPHPPSTSSSPSPTATGGGSPWSVIPASSKASAAAASFAELCANGRVEQLGTTPPLHPPLGSSRVPAAAMR